MASNRACISDLTLTIFFIVMSFFKKELSRKTIQIYFDIKIAKRLCSNEQKVIKVPNANIFKIVAPILISKGISRIVTSENLIAL